MEDAINFKEIYQIIKKHFIFILFSMLIAVIISAVITFFILTPRYEASTQILVNQSQPETEEGVSANDLQSSRELISTYNIIITSPAILEPSIENANFEGSVSELRSKIEVEAEEESQVVTVNITDENPQQAVNLANTLAQTFEQEIQNIMDVDNVSILSEAQLENSNTPVSPQPLQNLLIALALGLMFGIGLALLIEFLDNSIKNEEDLEKQLDLPLLGTVPNMKNFDYIHSNKNETPTDKINLTTRSSNKN